VQNGTDKNSWSFGHLHHIYKQRHKMTRFPKTDLTENFIFRLSSKQKSNLMLLANKKYKGSASEAIRALIEKAYQEL